MTLFPVDHPMALLKCAFLGPRGPLGLQGVSKKTLFNEIGTPGGPKTILRVGDHSKMLSNTFLLVRRTHLPIFIPFIDGFPQIMDQNLDHLSKIKSIADMYCSVCIRILYSKIFNNIHEKWFIQVDSFPISSGKLHLYKFSLRSKIYRT